MHQTPPAARQRRRSAATRRRTTNASSETSSAAMARAPLIAAFADTEEGAVTGLWTVGSMISINLGAARTVGLVYAIGKADLAWNQDGQNAIEVSVELIGEVRDREPPAMPVFDRGITVYPHIGAIAHRIRTRDLQAVYDLAGRHSVSHRAIVAGRDDRRPHRHRRHAGAPFRGRRHDRRRQVHCGLAAAAQIDRGAARSARADPRSAQRIRRIAPRQQRPGRLNDARPALLDVPAGRIRRSAVPRPRGRSRRTRRAARPDPGRQEPLSQPGRRRLICAAAAMR